MTRNILKMHKNSIAIDTKTFGRIAANVAVNKEMGSEVKKSVGRLELVHVSRQVRLSELREGTTGRPIVVSRNAVPRIMAVADPASAQVAPSPSVSPQPTFELAFYRKYTEAMLSRYIRVSMQPGRTPSLLGRELFRGDASHSTMTTFEDGIVFCIDVERCLARLRKSDQRLLQRIALQGYTHEEAAPLLGLSFKWCVIHYGRALDRLTELFLTNRLIEPSKMLSRP